ncbi:MAG: MFS transporter [Spirochaetes bacterium]|nr:MFS transporter [Spirochaetota bacterium]
MSNYRLYGFILLSLLYLTQGIPFGFQVTALPVILRQSGISLTMIGFSSMLALPWMLKIVWAPLVDRFWMHSLGRRKSWLLPLQTLMLVSAYSATHINITLNPVLFGATILVMNFCASVQDVAVDGLAIDILKDSDLGYGNAIQVVGYKMGMLISGGFLVWLSSYIGWHNVFYTIGGLIAVPLFLLIPYKETSMVQNKCNYITIKDIFDHIKKALTQHGMIIILLLIATYKTGETFIDGMFKPFLVDRGFSASQIGLWQGTYGMAASIAGSMIGGVLASRYGIMRGLGISLLTRIVPLCGEWYCTLKPPSEEVIIVITIAEHFFGGMLTTAMFAFMMYIVDKVIGATHYTVLATIEVIGKSPGMWFSGLLADSFGYSYLFGLGIILSIIPIFLFMMVKRALGNYQH